MRGGVKTFFREPRRGALRSPSAFARGVARGTGGLVGGVLGGGVSAGASIFSAGFKIAVIGSANLSGDSQYARRRQLAAQHRATGVRQGLKMGAEALQDGFKSGLTGLVKAPVRGAMQSGASGAVRGLGLGLAGAFAKPMSGLAGFASKLAEGVGSEAKKVVQATQLDGGLHTGPRLRVRQPRLLADGILRPYQRTPPCLEPDDDDGAADDDEPHAEQGAPP